MPGGKVYQGKYEQLNLIGKGKYGIIYRIKSFSDGKEYVAKHISLDQIQQSVAKKELEIIQKLRHPYIVQYIDSFTYQNDFIIIMEYCKQKDLSHHIELMKSKDKYFNQNLIITWLFQLVLGLQFIHSKKILHRDIKPQNIFVDQNLNIKIGDFGISKILASTGQHCKTMIGTPYYLAPQICHQERYTSKADIWSLGCVVYQVCALQRPFLAKGGIFQLIEQIKIGKIKQIPSIYSQDLKKLVFKMLTRDQNKRPNTTQLLKDPVLVDLMIKNSSSLSLKKQYSKNIQKNKGLTDSFIDKQTNLVHEQLRQFQKQVSMKMQNLKKKEVGNCEIDEQYKQLKNKMQEIEKAINKAFNQLKTKTGDKHSVNKLEESIPLKNNSSLTDSSEMTIIQSVIIGQSKNSSSLKKSDIIKGNSSQNISKSGKNQFQNSGSLILAESVVVRDTDSISNNSSLKLNSKVSNAKNIDQSQQFEKTLVSQYQKTMKQNTLAKQTLEKLNFLQKTLSQNPDAVLNGSLLSFTLTMSQDQLRKSLNLGKLNPTNTLSLRLKNQNSLQETINFDLTKKEVESSQILQKAFMKKKQTTGESKRNGENKIIQVPKMKEQVSDELDQYYQDQFEEYYEEEEEDSLQSQKCVQTNKQRRRSELNTIISFYQQTLQQINNQSQINETMTNTQRVKNKYPLIMSEIKEQTGESGSILSKNNNSSNNNSSAF